MHHRLLPCFYFKPALLPIKPTHTMQNIIKKIVIESHNCKNLTIYQTIIDIYDGFQQNLDTCFTERVLHNPLVRLIDYMSSSLANALVSLYIACLASIQLLGLY